MKILDSYISKLPSYARETDIFYLRPLQSFSADPSAPWYAKAPIGRDTLRKKVKEMCLNAGVKGNKTNHSLRATGATQLYESGVPEKVIQERTGHRSLEALRVYERSNDTQHKVASSVLCASSVKQAKKSIQKSSQQSSMATQRTNSSGFSFSNLYGCTININAASVPTTSNTTSISSQSDALTTVENTEMEFDNIIASLMDSEFH